jgi:NAD(P)H dehydrogenase (quinone)
VTSAQLAAWASELCGRPVAHVDVPPTALVEGLQQHGLPPHVAQILASFDVAISRGELADLSDGVRQLTGRARQSLRAFLQAHHDAFQPR